MEKPNKYIGYRLNEEYVEYLEAKLHGCKQTIDLLERWQKYSNIEIRVEEIAIACLNDIKSYLSDL